MALRDLLARIRITTEGTQQAKGELRGIGDAADEAGRQGSDGLGRIDGALNKVRLAAVGAVGAIVAVAKALVDAASAGANFAQDLDLTSRALGLTLGRTRELERGLNRTGQDLSDLRGIVAGLRAAVGEALRGNETYAESLRGIGLEVSSLAGLDTPSLLREITQAVIDLEDVSATEFSFLANLLGDDDAARIIAAAGDIKQAMLAELRFTDEEISDALNVTRFKSDAENIGQDIQLGLAAGLGAQDDAPLGPWTRSQLDIAEHFANDLVTNQEDAYQRILALTEDFEQNAGGVWVRLSQSVESEGTVQQQRTQAHTESMQRHFERFGVQAGGVFSRLREHGEQEMVRLVNAVEQAAREANARLRAISLTTPSVPNPAALRGQGSGVSADEIANEQNFLDIVRGNNLATVQEAVAQDRADDPQDFSRFRFDAPFIGEAQQALDDASAPEPEDQDIYQSGAVL